MPTLNLESIERRGLGWILALYVLAWAMMALAVHSWVNRV